MPRVKFGDKATAEIVRGNKGSEGFKVTSIWEVEHWRDGKLLSKTVDRNLVTTEGLNYLLDTGFAGGAAKGTWYVALVESTENPIAGWIYDTWAETLVTEFTDYTGTRITYTEAAAASGSMTNSASKAAFPITADPADDVYGAALVSNATKDHHVVGDYIFCYSKFSTPKNVFNGDTLNVTITITASDT